MQSSNDPGKPEIVRTAKAALKFTVLPENYTAQDLNRIVGMAEYVLIRNKATDSWQVMGFNKKDVNHRFLFPIDLDAEGKIIESMAQLKTELASISVADLTSADNGVAIERVHELLTDHSKKMLPLRVIDEIREKEEIMTNKMKEFVTRMDAVLASPTITDKQKEELNAYMQPYRSLAANYLYKDINFEVTNPDSYIDKVAKQAQIVADTLTVNQQGNFTLDDKLVNHIATMGLTSLVNTNFATLMTNLGLDTKFPKTDPGQLDFAAYAIIPTQHAPRYKMLVDAISGELNKLVKKNSLEGAVVAQIDNINNRFNLIAPEVLKNNEKLKIAALLESNIRTNNVIGSIAHAALVGQYETSKQAAVESGKWTPLLQALNSIGDNIVRQNQILSVPPKEGAVAAPSEVTARATYYEPLMHTFVDGYLGHNKNVPGMTNNMLAFIIDTEKKLRKEGLSGIIFDDNNVKRIPSTTTVKNVFATMRTADPAVADRVVTTLFDKIKTMIETTPKGQANAQQETAYNNAFEAVKMMGADAIRVWNRNAAEKFYDLAFITTVPNKPDFKQHDYQKIIHSEKTEIARGNILLQSALNATGGEKPLPMHDELAKLPQDVSPKQMRENILAVVVNNYHEAYLNGRTKRYGTTVKDESLLQTEAAIVQMEKNIVAQGQLGLLGRDIDARGRHNREEIILPAALALRPEQFNKSIHSLYDKAKAALGNASAAMSYVYVNSFKILERTTGGAPKAAWNEINAADKSDKAPAMAIPEEGKKISEDVMMARYHAETKLAPQVESPPTSPTIDAAEAPDDSPRSDEVDAAAVSIEGIDLEPKSAGLVDSDAEEDKEEAGHSPLSVPDSPRSRSGSVNTPTPRSAAQSSADGVEMSKQKMPSGEFDQLMTKDILGKIADELATKRSVAVQYGFDQVNLWDKFSRQVTDISNDMVRKGENFNPDKFYATFMQTFMEGYLKHAKGAHDLFSDGIRDFLEKVDKYIHSFQEQGIVYKQRADLPGDRDKDLPAIKSMASRNDGDAFQNGMVKYLFENLQKLIEAPGTHAKFEERVFQRTIDAVNTMGPAGVKEWNKLAADRFMELQMENGKIAATYQKLTATGANEQVRRQTLLATLKIGLASAQHDIAESNSAVNEKDPKKAHAQKASAQTILTEIQKAKVELDSVLKDPDITRSAMNDKFKFILLQLFTKGYTEGRIRESSWGRNKTTRMPALIALENFIISVETGLNNAKQKHIFVADPTKLNPINSKAMSGKYVMSEVIFETANKLNPTDFNKYIQGLYNDLKGHLDSKQAFTNTFKILERVGVKAKEEWNAILTQDKGSNLADKLKIADVNKQLKEDDLEKKFDKTFGASAAAIGMFGKNKHAAAELKVDSVADQKQAPPTPSSSSKPH